MVQENLIDHVINDWTISTYRKQIEIARQVDRVYDFALPPLILHALFNKTARHLKQWLAISPRNAVTVLDTHDGIGVIDIGAEAASDGLELPGLIPSQELDLLVEAIHAKSGGQSRRDRTCRIEPGPVPGQLYLLRCPGQK